MKVQGRVRKIRFRNRENGWTVLVLETEDGPLTCVGAFLSCQEGEELRAEGELIFHPKYGDQFQVSSIEKIRPTSEDQLIAYLSSGLFPHIGPKRAKKLVDRFGKEVLEVIEKDDQALLEIPGIGEKKAKEIRQAILDQEKTRKTLIYLQSLDLGPQTAALILDYYGSRAQEVIEENPYQLAEEIEGIGFLTADRIAQKRGIEPDSFFRTKAALLYALEREMVQEGSCYWTKEEVTRSLKTLLGTDPVRVEEALWDLRLSGKIYVSSDGRIYLFWMAQMEEQIGVKLSRMLKESEGMPPLSFEQKAVEESIMLSLSDQQKRAILETAKTPIMVITGGPGTGKTTILRAILAIFESNHLQTKLAAPTGRAAKKMEQSTGYEALTIHRLLGYRGDGEGNAQIQFDEENPLPCDAVVVDEASMIDLSLMNHLVMALPEKARLVLVGDADQLPSVGPGKVLQDLLSTDLISRVKLSTIYRQENDSLIVTNAHRIHHGMEPIYNQEYGDFFFLPGQNPMDTADLVEDLVSRRLPAHYGFDPMMDIQVLCPMKKGPCGVEALNERLQRSLNPKREEGPELLDRKKIFRKGDKVMQIHNDYDLEWISQEGLGQGVYNGDSGIIKEINEEEGRMIVSFDGREVTYEGEKLQELDHSYAITIHKSQGSEFSCVILPLVPGIPILLTRNLLYTAITRAQKVCVLVGSRQTIRQMILNNRTGRRNSSLKEAIEEGAKTYEQFGGEK